MNKPLLLLITSHWNSTFLSRRLTASAAPYTGRSIYYAKYVEISKCLHALVVAYLHLDLLERAEKAARYSLSPYQRGVLEVISANNDVLIWSHYLLAMVLLQKGLRLGLVGCFKDVRAELRSCLNLRPKNIALLISIADANSRMYWSALLTTERHKIWWEERNGQPYDEYFERASLLALDINFQACPTR